MSGPAATRLQHRRSQFSVSPLHPDHPTHTWSGLPGPKPVPIALTGLSASLASAGAQR
jgi:hypothetical protein